MDFNRLPSRRYADEEASSRRQQHSLAEQQQQRPHREGRQHQHQHNTRHDGQPQSFVPPSAILNQPILPPLSSQISSTSGSTKYSPGIDALDKDPNLTNNGTSASVEPVTPDYDAKTPADSTAHLFRDTQGNVYHPSVTFAPAPSPRGVRPNTLGLPSLSFGGGGGGHTSSSNSDPSNSLHPGMGNRRGSSRAAEDGAAGAGNGGFSGADFKRKRSLVRPERERVNPDARHFHYAQHSAAFQAENGGRVGVSETGYGPTSAHAGMPYGGGQGGIASYGLAPGQDGRPGLRRGKSILAREEGMAHESGLNFLKRGATLRRNTKKSKEQYGGNASEELLKSKAKDPKQEDGEKAPLTPWMLYCYAITCCLPGVVLKSLGELTEE